MECSLLSESRAIRKIYFVGDGEPLMEIGDKPHDAKSIRVVPVAGQGAYVPWIEVLHNNGCLQRWNVAMIEGVEYAPA